MTEKRNHFAVIRRGDLFLVNLANEEESLWRPVLVIQNDIGNRFSNSVIVTPLIQKPRTTRFLFGVNIAAGQDNNLLEDYIVLLSQIRTIEKDRFNTGNFMGNLSTQSMAQVDKALELSLGLSFIQRLESKQGRTEKIQKPPSNNVGS